MFMWWSAAMPLAWQDCKACACTAVCKTVYACHGCCTAWHQAILTCCISNACATLPENMCACYTNTRMLQSLTCQSSDLIKFLRASVERIWHLCCSLILTLHQVGGHQLDLHFTFGIIYGSWCSHTLQVRRKRVKPQNQRWNSKLDSNS